MIKTSKKGLTLLELLIVCVIMATILVPCVGMLTEAFKSQVDIEQDIKTRQTKIDISQMILSKIREGSASYYSGNSLSLPINGSTVSVSPEDNTLAVLTPVFDSSGNLVQPSTNVTRFNAIAFSILPKQGSSNYQLWEVRATLDLQVSSADALKTTQTLPSSWSNAQSYLVSDELKPANMTNMEQTAFDVEGDSVSFSFVPKDEVIYFPSSQGGSTSIDDSRYITACTLRNYRIQ